jgi:curved DNA-binding protein
MHLDGNEKSIGLRTVDGNIKTFKISVPAGIQNNEKIRLIGQGKRGTGGAKNGDLFIKVKIDDNEKFKLDGFDLRTNLYLTPWEAALSTKVNVQTIDEELSVYIPSGIQSGEEIKIENKGYKDGKGGRGNLILETKIMVPKAMSKEEEKLFKQLKEESRFNPRSIA